MADNIDSGSLTQNHIPSTDHWKFRVVLQMGLSLQTLLPLILKLQRSPSNLPISSHLIIYAYDNRAFLLCISILSVDTGVTKYRKLIEAYIHTAAESLKHS